MKIPQTPPNFQQMDIVAAIGKLRDPAVQQFIAGANADYLHWDQLRRKPPPDGLSVQQAWTAVKLSRLQIQTPLPLRDPSGKAFTYWLPGSALALLHEVDRNGGGYLGLTNDAASTISSIKDKVVVSSLMEEAIATAQIEGAATTRQVAKKMLVSRRKPRNRSEQMILNSYHTIQLIRQRLDRPLTSDLLFEIQEAITRDTLDDPETSGRYRVDADKVSVVDAQSGEVIYTPPPPSQLLKRMRIFFEFVNASSDEPFLHPLVKASIIHFWLAYEHPFPDGNGRTSRALFYWFMLKKNYWLFEFLTISRSIQNALMQYYKAFLYSESDENDLTYFLLYQLKVTKSSILQLKEHLARKVSEQKVVNKALRQLPGLNLRQRALMEHALQDQDGVYTFQWYQDEHKVTYVTARADLLDLLNRGLLQETKLGRQRAFLPAENLAEQIAASSVGRSKQ